MSFSNNVQRKAVDISKLAVEMTSAAGSGHPSTALSLAHIVTILMYHQMRWDPKNPWSLANDRLVLSEGHAVPIVYAAYADIGGYIGKSPADARAMTRADAMTLRDIDSPIDGHPHPQVGFPFFDAATGSLGQGLSVAAGLGAAAHMDKSKRNIYCIIGDGESREGQIWEAMDFIADQALTNVIPIFNCNELAQSDWVSPQQSAETLARKAEAYGFITTVVNGHCPNDLARALRELNIVQNGRRPLAIIAKTVKGWGSASEQGMGKHGTAVKSDKMKSIFDELEATAKDVGASDKADLKITVPATPIDHPKNTQIRIASFADGMAAVKQKVDKLLAPRKAYGAALVALGKADKRIVGLDADVKNSTHAEWFAQTYPDQYLECKIAEQNMVSVAAGLSSAGKIPFCSTFAKFVVRAYDQVEMAIIGGANLKITGTHAGVTLAADGPSQMSLSDAAFFRSFCHTKNFNGRPAVSYFFPADAVSCYKITELMANLDGCCYQRALRAEVPILYKPEETFEVGGFKVLREGKDLVLVAAGYMVHECLTVADELAKQGRKATVIDAYSLPMESDQLLEIAARNGNHIVTVEDNYSGGVDAEVALAIANKGVDTRLTNLVVDRIPKSGRTPEDVLAYLDLDAKAILKAIG